MSTFKITRGTPFHIDNCCDSVLSTLPLQLSEDILVVKESVKFTQCGCGSCNKPIAAVRLSKQTHLVLDPSDIEICDDETEIMEISS